MRCAWLTPLLLLPLLTGGCMTHALWTESPLDTWNEPAVSPNLRVFHDERRDNLLVVYDEFSDRHETTKARAYFLNLNQPPSSQERPHFVSVNTASGLAPVPVFCTVPTNPPDLFCTVADTNSPSFKASSSGRETGPYQLPVYNDGMGQVERVALTPVAVTLDLTIIGGVIVYCWLYIGAPWAEVGRQ